MGWIVATTQHYNAYANKSYDLFGFVDLLMFIPPAPDIVFVQVTSKDNRSSHLKKILSNSIAYQWLLCAHHHIWLSSWYQNKERSWQNDICIITPKDFEDSCLIDCYPDAKQNTARSDVKTEAAIAINIEERKNVTPETKKKTLSLIWNSTNQKNGDH